MLILPARVLQKSWILPALMVGFALVPLAMFGAVRSSRVDDGVRLAGLFCTMAAYMLWRNPRPRERSLQLHVEDRVLSVDGRQLRAADIVEYKIGASTQPHTNQCVVQLRTRAGKRMSLSLAREDAARLLEALQLEPKRTSFLVIARPRLLTIRLPQLMALLPILMAALLPLLMRTTSTSPLSWFWWIVGVIGLCCLLGSSPGKVTVGAEGVTLHRWRKRFVSFSQVARLDLRPGAQGASGPHGTQVVLRSGETLSLSAVGTDGIAGSSALHDALTSAFERYSQRSISDAADRWIAQHDERAAPYREVPLLPDDLAALTRDPRASSRVRVAAATALLRADPAQGRERIRFAADACSETELTRELYELADAEPEALDARASKSR